MTQNDASATRGGYIYSTSGQTLSISFVLLKRHLRVMPYPHPDFKVLTYMSIYISKFEYLKVAIAHSLDYKTALNSELTVLGREYAPVLPQESYWSTKLYMFRDNRVNWYYQLRNLFIFTLSGSAVYWNGTLHRSVQHPYPRRALDSILLEK